MSDFSFKNGSAYRRTRRREWFGKWFEIWRCKHWWARCFETSRDKGRSICRDQSGHRARTDQFLESAKDVVAAVAVISTRSILVNRGGQRRIGNRRRSRTRSRDYCRPIEKAGTNSRRLIWTRIRARTKVGSIGVEPGQWYLAWQEITKIRRLRWRQVVRAT